MKAIRLYGLALACSAMLAGCGVVLPAALETAVSITRPAAAAGDKVILEGTRGLIIAHNAAQAGIAVVNPLVDARVLTPAQVERYALIIDRVEQLAVSGRTTLNTAQRTAELLNIADELNRLAGK